MRSVPRRGQVFSLDLIISFAAVISVLLSVFFLWTYVSEKVALHRTTTELREIARDVSTMLITSRGNPRNWTALPFNTSNVKAIGLASEPWHLSRSRMERLQNSSYNTSLAILGVLGPGYGYHIDIQPWNGTEFKQLYTIGPSVPAADFVVVQQRMAMYNGSWTSVIVRVWKQ